MIRKFVSLLPLFLVALATLSNCASAQTYTYSEILALPATSSSSTPSMGSLIQASDGNFYGTTYGGGTDFTDCNGGCGTVYQLTPGGALTTIYSFCSLADCADGASPEDGLIEGSDGSLYGTTFSGGIYSVDGICDEGCGSVFKISMSGVLTTLHSFNTNDGVYPLGGLVQGSDGNYYGMTTGFDIFDFTQCEECYGTIFKITPSGTFTDLHSFCGNSSCDFPTTPQAGLMQALDGNYYGTIHGGAVTQTSPSGYGGVFEMTPSGTVSAVYTFCTQTDCPDGAGPADTLIQGADGDLYGTTQYGAVGYDVVNAPCQSGCGTVFKVTTGGTLTQLFDFCATGTCGANGLAPVAGLLAATDGNFYGTTYGGTGVNGSGPTGSGIVFQITPDGAFTNLYNFPTTYGTESGLVQGADGNLYGTQTDDGYGGNLYKITVSPALPAPVQVALSPSTLVLGKPITLSWKVLNAYSTTMRQCYAFAKNAATGSSTGAGTWTGLQTGTVVNGVYEGSATITPTAKGVYTYALTCGGVESANASINVGPITTTTLMVNSPVVIGTVVTMTAGVTTQLDSAPITGSITFAEGSLTLGTIALTSDDTASLVLETSGLTAGTYPITATYSGSSAYLGSSATQNVVILGYPTATMLTVTPTTVKTGKNVTLSSTVTRTSTAGTPTGSVSFSVGGTVVGSAKLSGGTANLTLPVSSSITPGLYDITASYFGDPTDATSYAEASVVVEGTTKTSLTVTPKSVDSGATVTFSSTVTRVGNTGVPTGYVTFKDGATTLGSGQLNSGVATLTLSNTAGGILPVGTYAVTAAFTPYSEDTASTSAPVTITVYQPGTTTTSTLTITPATVQLGQTLTLVCTVSPTSGTGTPTGTVTFSAGTTSLGSAPLSGGSATLKYVVPDATPVGDTSITATYSGDANDQPSTGTASVAVTVLTSTSLVINPNPAPADHAVALVATVKQTVGTGVPTGSVTFTVGGQALGTETLTNGTATLNLTDVGIAAGTYPVVASYSGSDFDAASSVTMNVVIQ